MTQGAILGRHTGYEQTGLPVEHAELTHVMPGSPGGEYLRRFWHPVALESEVTDIPLPVRVLREDLILFRSLGGAYGLLHRRCAHRGASLEYGKCERPGLRCCYHGWLFAADGELLEAPGAPADTPLLRNVRQGVYPVEVIAGIVFAYLGPSAHRPAFPIYDTFDVSGARRVPYTSDYPCNWLHGLRPIRSASTAGSGCRVRVTAEISIGTWKPDQVDASDPASCRLPSIAEVRRHTTPTPT